MTSFRMKPLITTLLIALCSHPLLAQTEQEPEKSPKTDKPAAVEAAAAKRARAFDPSVSREERTQLMLQLYDVNGNGRLDPEEVKQIGRDRLLRWDKDRDGKVSQAELAKMRAQSRQMPARARAERFRPKKPSEAME